MKQPRVLDVSAGDRCMWIDTRDAVCTFVDLRPEVNPDVIADGRRLPFGDRVFDLAVFDPPHAPPSGTNSAMGERYGLWSPQYIREMVRDTGRELARVVKDEGFVAFKWNDRVWALATAVGWMSDTWRPLFGQNFSRVRGDRASVTSITTWVMFSKVTPDLKAIALSVPSMTTRRARALAAASKAPPNASRSSCGNNPRI